jgi:cytochrome c553
MLKPHGLIALAIALMLGASSQVLADDWLVDVDENTRAERLSKYLGGFSSAMWEVGERYQHMVQAIRDENFELAHYHWDKIGSAIRGGYLKRPGRQANSDKLFLDAIWPVYLETLASGDAEAIRSQFSQARDACMACHAAEDVGFMNDQPMFSELKLKAD